MILMEKLESLEHFYQTKLNWQPDNLLTGLGHFNVFRLDPFVGANAKPVPYKRRDFFKITLVVGQGQIHYADQVIEVQQQALIFTNPQIPYKWEGTDRSRSGFFCIFNHPFFHQFGGLLQYPVFQPQGQHMFELTYDQLAQATGVFEAMLAEIGSDYAYKYDALRNRVFDLLHFAMKMHPSSGLGQPATNAPQRISTLFLELLERQFPIDEAHPVVQLRSASEFAGQLNVHVNHLNRSVKQVTEKTTTQLIAERVLQESKILLRHSTWDVAEIAYSLGFGEMTHFNNFFKKHAQLSPGKFRRAAFA
jgi:AraC-like DNA-binding protein